jgi:hypothetical protein
MARLMTLLPQTLILSFVLLGWVSGLVAAPDAHGHGANEDCTGHSCDLGEAPEAFADPVVPSPDFFETLPDGSLPAPAEDQEFSALGVAGPIAPAAGQPIGALTGRIVFTSAGHGWTQGTSNWALQRPVLLEMNEDYGNLDQMNIFAQYAFNAGATVVPFRPIGFQNNEVIVDNVSPGVTWSGTWNNSGSTIYYGNPGEVPYRFASLSATETATATYVPNIPVTGFYPVYTWVRHGSDRTFQLYHIRHTGGESQVRVPHHMVGNGWVYLGTYYFNAGSNSATGAVIISNQQPSPALGSIVIADAIRFGNGMSTDGSGYPKEEEASRYWVKNSLGQGQSTALYDRAGTSDNGDNVGTPPRMAREMNREQASPIFKSIYLGYHTNAGSGSSRGTIGLHNGNHPGTSTPNQLRWAQIVGREVNDQMVALSPLLELPWHNRGTNVTLSRSDIAFGEINNNWVGSEFDATILEVAYHDNTSDARLLRDPKVRNWVARASYHAVVKYMNEFDGVPLNLLPEPPQNIRAVADGAGAVVVSWDPPLPSGGSGTPESYVVYRSTDGYGFGQPILVSGGNTHSALLTGLPAETDLFFRVAARNAGGESFPSATAGCRLSSDPNAPRVLVVNGNDRFDRFINIRQTPSVGNYRAPGHNGNTGTMDRVIPRSVNSFDYVVQHGQAIGAFGMPFDSCPRDAVINNQINLSSYPIVVWASGQQSTDGRTFPSIARERITTYLQTGGALFVSGSKIAFDLDRPSGPTAGDRAFLHNQLRARFVADDAGSYTVTPAAGSLFSGKPNATFDNGTRGIYPVRSPDLISHEGAGAQAALIHTSGGGGGAAIQYDASAGGGRVVFLAFPFETIASVSTRNQYMATSLNFLSGAAAETPPAILSHPQHQQSVQGENATLQVVSSGSPPLAYQWLFNGEEIPGAIGSSYIRAPADFAHAGSYQVRVSNPFGEILSDAAILTVTLPPSLELMFGDDFDTHTAANWVTQQSSSDSRVTFNYDYGPDGIPPAPGSGRGTTRGLKFESNLTNGVAAAISISPAGQQFPGDYRLRFDLWINVNGPFPAGGTGSTEHFTAGIGTTGTTVQWTGSGSNPGGAWFAVNGEGGSADTTTTQIPDFAAFTAGTLHGAASGIYAAGTASNSRGNGHPYYSTVFPGGQTAPPAQLAAHPQQTGALATGTVGMAWREVIIAKSGDTVEWFMDGLQIASIPGTALSGNNITLGYWDTYSSLSNNPAVSFGLADNVRVERIVTRWPAFVTQQPVDQAIAAGGHATFTAMASGSPAPVYQWQFNGEDISGATASSYSIAQIQASDQGAYSVVVSNEFGSATSRLASLTVATPPVITLHPQSQTVTVGDEVIFTASVTGSPPPALQWQFDEVDIDGAESETLVLPHASLSDAGSYRLIAINAAGTAISTFALLTVNPPPPPSFTTAGIGSSGFFEATLAATGDSSYLVEASTDLLNWVPLETIWTAEGFGSFSDPDWRLFDRRFYRARAATLIAVTDFEGYEAGDSVMFRNPSFSGSTTGFIQTGGGIADFTRITSTFPAGVNLSRVLHASWTFAADTPHPWLRLTTAGTANIPNPTVDFTGGIRFQIYVDRPVHLALGLRETNSTAPVGEDGGSIGAIEWAGGSTDNTVTPPKGRFIPAGVWTTVHFFLPFEAVQGHTGNGILESTTGKGVLENLTIVPADGTGAFNLYLGNFAVIEAAD